MIKRATLWNGDGSITKNCTIIISQGLVASVGIDHDLSEFRGEIVDANGRFVTPGIVDMHSHMGLDSWPYTEGGSDTNEMSSIPVHPELKSIDGFDPWDIAIDIINNGGVTTSLVLPGSGNIMGGEAFAFKTRKPKSNRAEHMLLNAGMTNISDGKQWRWMKMACGENAINYGRSRQITPDSRLGEGYLFRKRIDEAYQLKLKQDEWCKQSSNYPNVFSSKIDESIYDTFPERIEDESLIAMLRGDVLLNVHCYETYDLEMLVRLSKEFGFKISAFHHALEAWEVAELLAENNIGAAIFADHWGYKKEAYDSSVNAAKILTSKNVKVAFKSDHPVLNSQNLIFEAAKGAHYGLSPELAIRAVTSIPAELMGQDWRIGFVKPGYDADLVLWDKNPLELGAHPLKVFVDGYLTFKHKDFSEREFIPSPLRSPVAGITVRFPDGGKLEAATSYFNITGLISSKDAKWQPESKIIVENGVITCMGPKCVMKGIKVNLNNGWVVPGLIAAAGHLGVEEIAAESTTSAGYMQEDVYPAADGLKIGLKYSKELRAAFKAGFTTAISQLRYDGAVGSISTAFRIGYKVLEDNAFVRQKVAQHFTVGNSAKSSGRSSSVPGQIDQIRRKIVEGGKIPVCINVDSSSQMYPLLNLFPNRNLSSNSLIFYGGAESHVIASSIASKGVSVILSNARCTPDNWYNRDCLVSGSSPSGYQILRDAGVNVGIATKEDNLIRGLIWEAGWLVADLKEYPELNDFEYAKEVISLLTWNVAKAFKLDERIGQIREGNRPNFVVFDQVPGTLAAKVRLVVDGEIVENDTEQF